MLNKILVKIYISTFWSREGLDVRLTKYKVVRESDKSLWLQYMNEKGEDTYPPSRKNKSTLDDIRVDIFNSGICTLEAICLEEDVEKTIGDLKDKAREECNKRIEGINKLLNMINK